MEENKECHNGPAKKMWFDYKRDYEQALNTIRQIYGDNPWHEYQKIVGYLEGRIHGIEFMERQLDL